MFDKVIEINGFSVHARYTQATVGNVFRPLCARLSELHAQSGKPVVALLAAPPGAGKSTFVYALNDYAESTGFAPIVPLGMDGFHYPNAYLRTHTAPDGTPLSDIKGAPPTYDLAKMQSAIANLRTGNCEWPVYDRRLHDPAPEPLQVSGDIFIIEGNWLLLDEPIWRDLKGECDISIAIGADEKMLMPRLIARKVRGGMAEGAARAFCMRSDLNNIRLYNERRLPADIELYEHDADGTVELTPLSKI